MEPRDRAPSTLRSKVGSSLKDWLKGDIQVYKYRRFVFWRLPSVALVIGSALSAQVLWGAGQLTNEKALATVKQCISNNGAPRVLGVQDNQNGAVADVQFTNFQTRNNIIGNLTEVARADFAHYNDGRWVLRTISFGISWEVTCNTAVVSSSPGSAPSAALTVELVKAAGSGNSEQVKALLASGADPNGAIENGNRPLLAASRKGDLATIEALLAKGANVNIQGSNGETPLFEAAGGGELPAIKLLLARRADPNKAATDGSTPLLNASGKPAILEALLANGANANVKGPFGSTALIIATFEGQTADVRVLLAHGADVNIKNQDGKTALQVATEKGLGPIADMLRAKGAR
jgi:ankyrin repeat protein